MIPSRALDTDNGIIADDASEMESGLFLRAYAWAVNMKGILRLYTTRVFAYNCTKYQWRFL